MLCDLNAQFNDIEPPHACTGGEILKKGAELWQKR